MRKSAQLGLVGIVLLAGVQAQANERIAAPKWRPPAERRAKLVKMADKHRLLAAKPQLVEALKKSMPGLAIDADRVRVVQARHDDGRADGHFLGFARELGQMPGLVGVAGTPHAGGNGLSGGVHPQLLVHRAKQSGELGPFAWYYDTADRGPGFYNPKTGRHEGWTRVRPFDDTSSKPLVHMLWAGPEAAVNDVGLAAHAHVLKTNGQQQNCASVVGRLLAPLEGPFKGLSMYTGAGSFKALAKAAEKAGGPDLIVVTIPAGHWESFQDKALDHVNDARNLSHDLFNYPLVD